MTSNIYFSKAPEGATHYGGLDDFFKLNGSEWLIWLWGEWVQVSPDIYESLCGNLKPIPPQKPNGGELERHRELVKNAINLDGVLFNLMTEHIKMEGKVNKSMNIECKNEREKMLCEQVLRMCRGEESEVNCSDNWVKYEHGYLFIFGEYRAKPKKELVIPWDFLREDIINVVVTSNGEIKGYSDSVTYYNLFGLLLDLDGIDLPVTVKRPEVK